MTKIKNTTSIRKIMTGYYAVESEAEGSKGVAELRKEGSEWRLEAMDTNGEEGVARSVLWVFESFREAQRELKSFDLDSALALAKIVKIDVKLNAKGRAKAKAEEPEGIKVWLGKIAADYMQLDALDQEELEASGVLAVKFTKAWVHVTFASKEAISELAEQLRELESSDARTRGALKRAVATLRKAAI